MRKLKHLAFLAAMILPLVTQAQETLTVADQSPTTNDYLPLHSNYADYGAEQEFIYPAELLSEMEGGTISSIQFYHNSATINKTWNETFQVYVQEVIDASYESNVSKRTAAATLVWTGNPAVVDGVWTIDFTSEYNYNGGNLLVSIVENCLSGGVCGGESWLGTSSTAAGMYRKAASSCAALGSWTMLGFLPRATFEYQLGENVCYRVTNLHPSDITSDGATISWGRRGTENSWAVYLNGQFESIVYDSTRTFSSLTANTVYTAAVRAICGIGDTSSMSTISFRTACIPITIGTQTWTENFESWITGTDGFDPCWRRLGYYGTYLPQATSVTGPDGNSGKSLYGCAGNNAQPMFVILPQMESLDGLMVAFQAKASATNSSTIQVGYMTDPADTTTFQAVSVFNITSADGWKYFESRLDGDDINDANYIAFRLNNTNSGYYIYLDDIMVTPAPSCDRPADLAVRNITSSGAELVIGDETANNNYTVQVFADDTLLVNTIPATDTVVAFSNLEVNTLYKVVVVSNCNDGNTTVPISTRFHTSCVALVHDELPYVAHFDSLSTGVVTPDNLSCWTVCNATTSYPAISSSYHCGESGNSLCLYSIGQIAAMPSFADDLSSLQLSFQLRPYYNSYTNVVTTWVEVGVMSNPGDPSTFVPVQVCKPDTTGWYLYDATFARYTTGFIAFRVAGTSSQTIYIDSVVVDEVPSCVRPSSVAVSDLTPTSATITIADANNAGQYTLVVEGGDSTSSFGYILMLDTLSPNTEYTVRVRTICDNGNPTADFTTVSFRTLCGTYSIPDTNDFESETTNATPDCWTNLSGDTKVVDGSTSAHSGSKYLKFSGATRNMVALPQMSEEISGLQVHFWTRPENNTYTNCGNFQVGYITDLSDISTFVPVATYNYAEFAAYVEKEVSMAEAPEGARIAFLQKDCATNYYWYVDDVIVEPIPDCQRPVSVSVSDITVDGATINVNDPAESYSYRYYLAVNDSVVDSNYFYGESEMLQNLSANTVYTVSVVTVCGEEETAPVSTTFRTACTAITSDQLPYNEGFEDYPTTVGIIPCWNYLGSDPTKVGVVSARAHGGTKSFRFSSNASTPHVAILPAFEDGIDNMTLGFWFVAENATYSGDLLVGYVYDDTTFVAIDTFHCADHTTMDYKEVSFTNTPEGARIALAQRLAAASNYYWWIDDLTVNVSLECLRPAGLEVRNITTTSAELRIDDATLVNNYSVMVVSSNDTLQYHVAADTIYTLTGLTSGTGYTVYVRALCGADSTTAVDASFYTECEDISTLPYTEGFEGWGTGATGYHPCWNRFYMGSSTNHPYVMNTTAHTGSNALRMYSKYDNSYYSTSIYSNSYAFMPLFTAPVNTLSMHFWYKVESGSYDPEYTKLYLGVSSSTTDTSTFTRLATIEPVDNQWHKYEVEFSAYTGTGNIITIMQKNVNGDEEYDYDYDEYYIYSSAYGYIDDITIDVLGDCERPSTLVVSDVDDTHATLTWTDINGTGNYVVVCSNGDSVTVNNALTYTFTDLTPFTSYTVAVRRICDDGLTTARTVTFRTLATPVTVLPYNTGFENGLDACWEFVQGNSTQWFVGNVAASAGSNSLYISNDTARTRNYGNNAISYATCLFSFASGEYFVSFDWSAQGESDYDFLRVFAIPYSLPLTADFFGATTASTGVPAGWQDVVGGKLNLDSTWSQASGTFTVSDSGLYRLVFMWRADVSNTNAPAAAVDNVHVEARSCSTPSNLAFNDVTSTSVTLSWHSNGSENAWLVSVDNGTWRSVGDTTFTAIGLASSTLHTFAVRAFCGAGDTSFAVSGSVLTECAAIGYADLPWSENFDAITAMSDLRCWERYKGLYTSATTSLATTTSGWNTTSTAMGSSKHVKINIYGTDAKYWLASPVIDLVAAANLSFDYALTKYNTTDSIQEAGNDDRFMVLVTTDNGTTWTPLATWDSVNNAYASISPVATTDTISLAAFVGQQVRIAFYGESTVGGGDNDLHIDNVSVTLDSAAPQPTTYIVTLASANAAMGIVSPVGNTTVVENGSFTATATANNGYRFVNWTSNGTEVSAENPYTFNVTANISLTANFESTGTPVTCLAPTNLTVSEVAPNSATLSWTNGGSETAWVIDYNGQTVNVTTNPYTLTGLAASTSYTVAVAAVCGEGEVSEFSNTQTFTTSVGIDDVNATNVSLYPNPASSTVTLTGIEGVATVTVVDMNGRENGKWTVSDGTLTIDVSQMSQGAYFVRIVGEQVNAIRKLLVR